MEEIPPKCKEKIAISTDISGIDFFIDKGG